MLDATLNVTEPLPGPLVRPVTVIHDESELADHSHDEAAATEIELLFAPVAGNVTSLGETVTLQAPGAIGGGTGTPACCVTFTVSPATMIDAERVVGPAFDAIAKATLPAPVPVVPPVSTTHAASAWALHAQPAAAVNVILPIPPVAGTVCSVVESSNRQAAGS
jgi:hypothetical protein